MVQTKFKPSYVKIHLAPNNEYFHWMFMTKIPWMAVFFVEQNYKRIINIMVIIILCHHINTFTRANRCNVFCARKPIYSSQRSLNQQHTGRVSAECGRQDSREVRCFQRIGWASFLVYWSWGCRKTDELHSLGLLLSSQTELDRS